MRYRIDIEYDGTNYVGWQKQIHGLSIQEVIESCIFKLSGEKVELFGSGRTDAGVHALNQVAHFDLNKKKFSEQTIIEGLNYYLFRYNIDKINIFRRVINSKFGDFYKNYIPIPEQDIIIKFCNVVNSDFHARFSSRMRYYKYIIMNTKSPLALWRNRAWHIREKLELEPMQKACNLLLGKHDFSSFRDSQCQAFSPLKTINSCKIYREDDRIILEVSAKSFLHHMIRNIIGTLKDVGTGKIDLKKFDDILNSKNRQNAGINAPACGLYLVKIDY